jgi:hypothetical protein
VLKLLLEASAGLDTKEVDAALVGIDEALRAKFASARQAATLARQELDENAAEIARLDRELASLGRREAATA